MPSPVRHPLFARVLDLGAGDGANFAHFPPTVDEVVAIERYRRLTVAPCIMTAPVAPHVLGVARRRG